MVSVWIVANGACNLFYFFMGKANPKMEFKNY